MNSFWIYMLLTNLLVPLIILVAGRMMWKHYPNEINGLIGYRTNRSMRNMDTWKFANEYAGKLWWKLGWLLLVVSIVAMVPYRNASEDTIGIVVCVICSLQCIALIGSIIPVEVALCKNFDEEGNRK